MTKNTSVLTFVLPCPSGFIIQHLVNRAPNYRGEHTSLGFVDVVMQVQIPADWCFRPAWEATLR